MKKLITLLVFIPYLAIGQLTGIAISITDGDTFTLLTTDQKEVRIRLHGIDCPEKSQDYGQVAKKFLSDLIYNKVVNVVQMDVDKYGRTIGMVTIGTINVNAELLKAGLAWHYKHYDQNPEWAKMEDNARKEKKGLWAMDNTIPPWEWRMNKN